MPHAFWPRIIFSSGFCIQKQQKDEGENKSNLLCVQSNDCIRWFLDGQQNLLSKNGDAENPHSLDFITRSFLTLTVVVSSNPSPVSLSLCLFLVSFLYRCHTEHRLFSLMCCRVSVTQTQGWLTESRRFNVSMKSMTATTYSTLDLWFNWTKQSIYIYLLGL